MSRPVLKERRASRPGWRESAGFTLAELVVATTLLTIIMTAVYTSFGTTVRMWRLGESDGNVYQDARTALAILDRELHCVLGGSEHLFEGKDDEFEFFVVAPPMWIDKDDGPRVMKVRYRLDRTNHRLVREERLVEKPLPLSPPDGSEIEPSRVKVGRPHKFDLASNVRGFDVEYIWFPPVERKADEPPEWQTPLVFRESRQNWGLPQGISITLTLEDSNARGKRVQFKLPVAFRGPTSPYDERRMGEAKRVGT